MAEKARSDESRNDHEPSADSNESSPSIPDGGLDRAMPEWLRRPPAWRTIQRQRAAPTVASPEQAPMDQEEREESQTSAVRLPADTSTIDPAALVRVEDLPKWLRQLAERSQRPPRATSESPDTVGTDPVSVRRDDADAEQGSAEIRHPVGVVKVPSPSVEERDIEQEPETASPAIEEDEPGLALPSSGERIYAFAPESDANAATHDKQHARSFSGIDYMVVVLGIALIAALGIILLLVIGGS